MVNNTQLFVLLALVLLALLVRDLPYVNVIFINRIWFIFFAILLFMFLVATKYRVVFLWCVTCILFIIAFFLTLMRLDFFAESIGVLIYFSLWTMIIHRLVDVIKGRK